MRWRRRGCCPDWDNLTEEARRFRLDRRGGSSTQASLVSSFCSRESCLVWLWGSCLWVSWSSRFSSAVALPTRRSKPVNSPSSSSSSSSSIPMSCFSINFYLFIEIWSDDGDFFSCDIPGCSETASAVSDTASVQCCCNGGLLSYSKFLAFFFGFYNLPMGN